MKEKTTGELKIVCPFCNTPYTAEMEEELYNASGAISPSGYGASANIVITIKCSNCNKVVYKKETTVS